MNKYICNNKGITLVELLAVLVIGSIVMVLIMGIFSNGQKQYSIQTTHAEQLADVRYTAKVITKEIRQAERIKWTGTTMTIGNESPIVMTIGSDVILKGGQPFITHTKITGLRLDGSIITLTMESTSEEMNKKKTIETQIYIREGVVIE
ncbi:PilW family protein [Planomicrobium sp. YIM 101495]|uniref:PilW family protein n=1 Tax=Planomicrobium sp. YIM 101495 TaxID=2665160 RepID=UPI0012B840BE|nr:prepilin-type N-terminal cleavage/methylation domain-containing protein [Planomicrobium sp. YIM 101495]MTD29616.1 prepilin-type N-terminal cleavage/methylation domain-containing protein [Planomicrobium sp. YIM 101495]